MITLYPYQKQGVEAMRGQAGFLLADEMGLGKTYQALSEIYDDAPDVFKVLIVCPNSVKSVWEDAIREFFPVAPVVILDGPHRGDFAKFKRGFCIINWEAVRLLPGLKLAHWDWIIADEAHKAKNRKAKMTKALKQIKGDHKRALTGTPLVNRPDELWSILHWLYPKVFTSYWKFFERFVSYWQHPQYGYKEVRGPKNVEELQALIKAFTLRRLKHDVLPELPDKYYTTIRVELTGAQRAAYDEMKRSSIAWLEQYPEDMPLEAPTVLAQLTRLRQFASAYCQIMDDGSVAMSEPSSKLDALMEIVSETDEPIVVFSQFKQLIQLAHYRLTYAGIPTGVMTGDVSQQGRKGLIERFQQGRVRVFLATMQTGGVGVTLHKASTCVFLDRSWSPAMNLQAEDRLHRIGQKNAVQIIKIEANRTVDQTVESKLEKKREWFRQILGD